MEELNPYSPLNGSPSIRGSLRKIGTWLIPLALGIMTPFAMMPFSEGDVNNYFSENDSRASSEDEYYWKREGWFFPMTQSHSAWPQLGVQAESEWLPLGVLLNIAFATAIWYAIWSIAWGCFSGRIGIRKAQRSDKKRP